MRVQDLHIEGTPVTFATRCEKEWKAVLAAGIPSSPVDGKEAGLVLRFVLPTLAPQGQPLDIDNLCEPVFVVVVRQAGWFGRSKPRLRWWSATKEVGTALGCSLTISKEPSPVLPGTASTYRETYQGVLPTSALSPEVPRWAAAVIRAKPKPLPETCILHLEFGSHAANIGDISTGVVKHFVDCLYPFYGGIARAPEDWRVRHLIVEKAVAGLPSDAVRTTFWFEGHSGSQPPRVSVPTSRRSPLPKEGQAVTNPCRPGSAKWIVCEGAIQGKLVAAVQAELEALKPGYGSRIREYLSDARAENHLDVQIEGSKLVCRGSRRS